jgi:hypothetical protein
LSWFRLQNPVRGGLRGTVRIPHLISRRFNADGEGEIEGDAIASGDASVPVVGWHKTVDALA